MLEKSVIEQLEAIVGPGHLLTRKVDLVTYSYDATADVPRQIPDIVVMPGNVEEIRKIVNLARSRGIAIYPRGVDLDGCHRRHEATR